MKMKKDKSDYIFNYILGDKERKLIPFLLSKSKKGTDRIRTLDRVCNKFGLSKAYIKNKYCYILDNSPTNLGAKIIPYYIDEMSYGKNTHHYTMDDLSTNEITAYNELQGRIRE
mgnify:FL=1|tara:strand:+ start:2558 stop:2899 length:342 start_codon:yes stop_codon:yes gene_type:complete